MNNPIKTLSKREWILWMGSLAIVLISNVATTEFDGLTLMAVWSTVTWMKNPSKENGNEVEIQTLNQKHVIGLAGCGVVVTAIFYLILAKLNTPNIVFSTISIITIFLQPRSPCSGIESYDKNKTLVFISFYIW